MAETITIPSPTAFLATSTVLTALSPSPPRTPQSKQRRKPQGGRTASVSTASQREKLNNIVKPKQSKSRNGCITCKAKRLKCDEIKPTCQQCRKRSVPCGGYFKDYKWKPFEETSLNTRKVLPPRPRGTSIPREKSTEIRLTTSPTASDVSLATPDIEIDPELTSPLESEPIIEDVQDHFDFSQGTPYSEPSVATCIPKFLDISSMEDSYNPTLFRRSGSATVALSGMFDGISMATPRSSVSDQSDRLNDFPFLFPGFELDINPHMDLMQDLTAINERCEDSEGVQKIENISRLPDCSGDESWTPEFLFRNFTHAGYRNELFAPFYRQPGMRAGSPEMLMVRFDKQTCGILSVKDGPTENPWRTLIWPLARNSPALWHAIASMTAFHTSKDEPALRVDGMEHMRESIRLLSHGLSDMRPDTALATTLALAFSESWDQHISTGIKHLRGAKILVNQALIQHNKRPLAGNDLGCLKFLCNTFIYMDVIARLTSVDADESNDFESLISPLPGPFGSFASSEIDPLMGCASTLFPLIGRAANLCRKARRSESNSIAIVSQAMELKQQIEQWDSNTSFERPEDPSSEVEHALQTADAYRYATLLYLHQAVPEIPSLTTAQLAKKVLVFLATVPLSSRLVIVQIYPLLAAGCEAIDQEDRDWVRDRWNNMSARMWIGNIDRCCEVMLEVWLRRDDFVAKKEAARREQQQNQRRSIGMAHSEISKEMSEAFSFNEILNGQPDIGGSKRENRFRELSSRSARIESGSRMGITPSRRNSGPITENIEPEYTVRGHLHWVGVMKDWGWEVFL